MTVTIYRAASTLVSEPRPSWCRDERGRLFIRCECGELIPLRDGPEGHQVGADGAVSPSLVHQVDDGGCGWHAWGRLEGWTH